MGIQQRLRTSDTRRHLLDVLVDAAGAILAAQPPLLGLGAVGEPHLDLVGDDVVVDALQHVTGQVLALVNASIVTHERLLAHAILLSDRLVERVGVQHDDGERQHFDRLGRREQARVLTVVRPREGRGDAVDLLGLTRQEEPGLGQQVSHGLID